MRRTILELGGVAGLVVLLALLGQLVLPHRIPFLTTYAETATDSGIRRIPAVLVNGAGMKTPDTVTTQNGTPFIDNPSSIVTAEVYRVFTRKSGMIIDARDSGEYTAGHITGAWNIPYSDFLIHVDQLETLPMDTLIVAYCNGEECNASLGLANQLAAMGFSRVRFYFGGWSSWVAAGYPTAAGSK